MLNTVTCVYHRRIYAESQIIYYNIPTPAERNIVHMFWSLIPGWFCFECTMPAICLYNLTFKLNVTTLVIILLINCVIGELVIISTGNQDTYLTWCIINPLWELKAIILVKIAEIFHELLQLWQTACTTCARLPGSSYGYTETRLHLPGSEAPGIKMASCYL